MERDQTARSPDWGLGGDRAAVAGWLGNAGPRGLSHHAALNATLIRSGGSWPSRGNYWTVKPEGLR